MVPSFFSKLFFMGISIFFINTLWYFQACTCMLGISMIKLLVLATPKNNDSVVAFDSTHENCAGLQSLDGFLLRICHRYVLCDD